MVGVPEPSVDMGTLIVQPLPPHPPHTHFLYEGKVHYCHMYVILIFFSGIISTRLIIDRYLIFKTNDVLLFVLDIFVPLTARICFRMINTGRGKGGITPD